MIVVVVIIVVVGVAIVIIVVIIVVVVVVVVVVVARTLSRMLTHGVLRSALIFSSADRYLTCPSTQATGTTVLVTFGVGGVNSMRRVEEDERDEEYEYE